MIRRLLITLAVLVPLAAAATDTPRFVMKGQDSASWLASLMPGLSIPNECTGDCPADLDAAAAALLTRYEDIHNSFPIALFPLGPAATMGSDILNASIDGGGFSDMMAAKWGSLPWWLRPWRNYGERIDVVLSDGRPWTNSVASPPEYNYSSTGCPHGTMGHEHHDGENAITGRRCRLHLTSWCADTHDWCRCADPDGTITYTDSPYTPSCKATYAEDCPGSACVIAPFLAEYLQTKPAVEADTEYSHWQSAAQQPGYGDVPAGTGLGMIELATTRNDQFCDVAMTNQDQCPIGPGYTVEPDGTPANPETFKALLDAKYGTDVKRANYYLYWQLMQFAYGANTDLFGAGSIKYATGCTVPAVDCPNKVKVSPSPGWTIDEWAGGRAMIRIAPLTTFGTVTTWEARPIVSNTADTVTVGPNPLTARVNWVTPPTTTTAIGLLHAAEEPTLGMMTSAALADVTAPGYTKFAAAMLLQYPWMMRAAADDPVVITLATKMGLWSRPKPNEGDGELEYAACGAPGGASAWSASGRAFAFLFPTPYYGDAKCRPTNEGGSAWDTPYARGEYERAICQIGVEMLRQMRAMPYYSTTHGGGGHIRLAVEASDTANKYGTGNTSGEDDHWWGVCSAILRDPLYIGAIGAADHNLTDATWPFVAGGATQPGQHACSDGLDNDNDGTIDYPTDPGCASAADDTE